MWLWSIIYTGSRETGPRKRNILFFSCLELLSYLTWLSSPLLYRPSWACETCTMTSIEGYGEISLCKGSYIPSLLSATTESPTLLSMGAFIGVIAGAVGGGLLLLALVVISIIVCVYVCVKRSKAKEAGELPVVFSPSNNKIMV